MKTQRQNPTVKHINKAFPNDVRDSYADTMLRLLPLYNDPAASISRGEIVCVILHRFVFYHGRTGTLLGEKKPRKGMQSAFSQLKIRAANVQIGEEGVMEGDDDGDIGTEQVGMEGEVQIIAPPTWVFSVIDLTEGIASEDDTVPPTPTRSASRKSARLGAGRRRMEFGDHMYY